MVTCPECGSEDLERIEVLPDGGRRLRCLICGHEWVRGSRSSPPAGTTLRVGDPTAVVLFDSDDAAYEAWIAKRPGAYVLNTYRPPAASYLVLHLADCFHISVEDERFSSTSWTGNEYMKVCAPRRQDLIEWTRQQFGIDPIRCSHCDP